MAAVLAKDFVLWPLLKLVLTLQNLARKSHFWLNSFLPSVGDYSQCWWLAMLASLSGFLLWSQLKKLLLLSFVRAVSWLSALKHYQNTHDPRQPMGEEQRARLANQKPSWR